MTIFDNKTMPKIETYIQQHKDGSLWTRGQVIGDLATGYWEWFRKDGTLMRSGNFLDGRQVGKWTTYDKQGEVYKVTDMKDGKPDENLTIIKKD